MGKSARLERMVLGLLIAFFMAALALVFWAVLRAPALAQRGDNPRVVEAELQIRRGRILDANGVVLAETLGNEGAPIRHYPIPNIGPAVGYYSFRYGTAGVEQGYDATLRGANDDSWEAFWRETLHRPRVGQDIRLTLDADWQREAEAMMGDRKGALLLLAAPDGAVKAMVSHPTYNPNELDAQFFELADDSDAPLLNRVTQGFYQPGLALQPFILAAALDRGFIEMGESVQDASATITVRDLPIQCREMPPEDATWATVLQMACPAPMATLAGAFSADSLTESLERFGLYEQPDFSLPTAQSRSQPVVESSAAILGQEFLTVTPLQMARAWVALANGGELPQPYLVREVQSATGVWQEVEPPQASSDQAVDASTADVLLAALAQYEDSFLEHSVTALSGPGEAVTAWYLGFSSIRFPRYAVVVVVEGAADAAIAQNIGRATLQLTQTSQ